MDKDTIAACQIIADCDVQIAALVDERASILQRMGQIMAQLQDINAKRAVAQAQGTAALIVMAGVTPTATP